MANPAHAGTEAALTDHARPDVQAYLDRLKAQPRPKLTRTSNVAGGPGPVKPKPTTPK